MTPSHGPDISLAEGEKYAHFRKEPVREQPLSDTLSDHLASACERERVCCLSVVLTAFVALVHRYTRGESDGDLRLSIRKAKEPVIDTTLNVALRDDMTLRDAIHLVQKRIEDAVPATTWLQYATSIPHGTTIRACWSEKTISDARRFNLALKSTNPIDGELSADGNDELDTGAHWRTLIGTFTGSLDIPVSRIPIVGSEEKSLLLEQLAVSEVDADLICPECLHNIFESQAREHPQRIALQYADQTMTYGALDAQANRLAAYLQAKGIASGFVGILLPRSMDIYAAMLGILKAGAAYVPIDPSYPADRIEYTLNDCGASALITNSELAAQMSSLPCDAICLDKVSEEIDHTSSESVTTDEHIAPDRPAYMIYTSGTTGRPKGVVVEHRNVCGFIRAEGKAFGVGPDDRVYQGFSTAFDASVEEIWLAFRAGATLVVGSEEMVHAGPALAHILADAGVTVLSCVPTLLSMMDEDIPTVRLLILGGEQCPKGLVDRWWRPYRRVINSYGPTETTVVATFSDCHPDRNVTIGRPLPNYFTYILDEHLQLAPVGIPGELCIGGVGVTRGYMNRPELTADKFIPNPFADTPGVPDRLYRTGDLVRYASGGEIEFLGRIDEQVKIRGFRVELSEIESVLMRCPGVRSAVISVREDMPGLQQLVAYVIPLESRSFDEREAKAMMRSLLPPYMMPSAFVVMEKFPTLASGKVNRKLLPPPSAAEHAPDVEQTEGRTDVESKVLAVWRKLFQPQLVSVTDDFFDLGGHSLLAARMVSELRTDPKLGDVAMLDVYRHPILEDFAREIGCRSEAQSARDAQARTRQSEENAASDAHSERGSAFTRCSVAQFLGLYPLFSLMALPWLVVYFAYLFVTNSSHSVLQDTAVSLGVFLGLFPFMVLLSITVKWVVIGRYKEGSYPLWGSYYWRFWFVQRIRALVPLAYLRGTPFLAMYYRLLGAKIGSNVYLGSQYFTAMDLISIGNDASIGLDAQIQGYTIEKGMLIIGPVTIGNRCYVGAKSVLHPNVTLKDDAQLDELSMLTDGLTIPESEVWSGSPARFSSKASCGECADESKQSSLRRAAIGAFYLFGLFLLLPAIPISAMIPGCAWMVALDRSYGQYWTLLAMPLVSALFVVTLCLEIAVGKWMLLGRMRPGRYKVHSAFYARKWFVDALMQMGLDILHPLYATLYLVPWFRLLGAHLGRRVEISTVGHITPDLLSIGPECFFADSACVGAMKVHLGILHIEETKIGKRTFIGNSALIPSGTRIGDGCLIGVLSTPPPAEVMEKAEGTSWLGSPSVRLPRRQASATFSSSVTFNPPLYLYLVRGIIEFFRVTLPATLFGIMSVALFEMAASMYQHETLPEMVLLFPLVYVLITCALVLAVICLKWAVMGQYRPCNKPLWSSFVWRTEMVTAVHETFCAPFLLNFLQGTPFIAWYFRLMGSKIGKRVYMETTQITEFDLARIGDDATLNMNCTIQTHLFEDRVMKTSYVDVGSDAAVGQMAVVLYDSKMEKGSSLNGLSLLMKGETLPSYTRWEGIPALLRTDSAARAQRRRAALSADA